MVILRQNINKMYQFFKTVFYHQSSKIKVIANMQNVCYKQICLVHLYIVTTMSHCHNISICT